MSRSVDSLRQPAGEDRTRELLDERRFLHQLRVAIREPLDPTPGDFGLDRMRAEIERLEAPQRRRRLGARLRAWMRLLRGGRQGSGVDGP